jgi:transcriptional regulator with XRE-family HTH domain
MSQIFADRVKAARALRSLSQAELAEATKLQVSAISHFETGTRSPSFDNLRKIADALQVATDYLIGRSDSPTLSSETAASLFRKAEKLTAKDLEFLEQMADQLAKRNS